MKAIEKVKNYNNGHLTIISINENTADIIYHGKEFNGCKVEVFGPEKQYVFIETNYMEAGDGPIINTNLIK
jgi:hypothetical protein